MGTRMPGGRSWEKRTLAEALRFQEPVPHGTGRALFADAELRNYNLVTFGVVLLQIVQQATPLADQDEKSAARAVVFLVRFEMIRQLTNALAQQCDLNFRTTRIGGVRAIGVNDGLFLLSG